MNIYICIQHRVLKVRIFGHHHDDVTSVNNIRIKCEPKTFMYTLVQILRESHHLSDFTCRSICHKFQIATFIKQKCVRSPWRSVSYAIWLIAVFIVSSTLTHSASSLLSSLFVIVFAIAVLCCCCCCCCLLFLFLLFSCCVCLLRRVCCCLLLFVTRRAWWYGDDGHDDSPAGSTRCGGISIA